MCAKWASLHVDWAAGARPAYIHCAGLSFGMEVGVCGRMSAWSASRSSPLPSNPLLRLPLGEHVALSGLLTQDMWPRHPAEAARGYRGCNARAPPHKAGVFLHQGRLSQRPGSWGADYGAFFCASEWSPQRYLEANSGTPSVLSQTKQNKTKPELLLCCNWSGSGPQFYKWPTTALRPHH